MLLRKETQEQQWPIDGCYPVRSEPIGSVEAVWLHKFRSDSTWETPPSALHISSISLHLQEWHCPRKTTCQICYGVLVWASPQPLRERRDLKCHPLCAVIRYRTTKGFAVSDRACELCCRVSLWLINTLFICLHVHCPEHLLQPSLGVFTVKPTQFIEARIALVHFYLAYPAQNTYIF